VLLYTDVVNVDEHTEWSGEALSWARAEGCSSPTQPEYDSDSDGDF
jgi:hypothetical protein